MLKRINVEHLKLGMHLHELCGSWMSHPFWRTSFVLKDPKDIQRIHDSGIREAWIDSGYPHRLQGEAISHYAKMGAVCDVYDAVTSDRPYKKGWDPAEAVRRMAEWSKGHFQNEVFQAFVKAVGIYPVGTLVRLHTGRLGVVVDQSGRSLLTPKVKVFFSTKSQLRLPPEIIDLASPGCNEKITAHENPAKWGFPDLEELWRGAGPRPW